MTPKIMLPPTYFLIAAFLMLALHFAFPVARVLSAPLTYSGFLFVTSGIILAFWAASRFRRAGTPLKPFAESITLVIDGPFKYTRNPMYLGLVLILTGLWLGLGSLTPALVIPAFVWLITITFIRCEERLLEARFSQHYIAYKARVRCWL